MLYLSKKLNEKGLTLVELLAVIVLTAITSILLFSVMTKALENTKIISQETQLRDEADIIISKFIKTLYSTRQDHIIRNITDENGSYLEVTNDLSQCGRDEFGNLINERGCSNTLQPIGFKKRDSKVIIHLLNEKYEVVNNGIEILPNSKIKGNPTITYIYEIELNLKVTHIRGNKEKSRKLTFKNEVQPIVNTK